MRRFRTCLALLWVLAGACASAYGQSARIYRDRVEPHWIDGETRSRFWYSNDLPGGRREFVLVDVIKGSRTPAFDHDRLAQALSKEIGKPVEAGKFPFDEVEFPATPGDSMILVGTAKSWSLNLKTYALRPESARLTEATWLLGKDAPASRQAAGPATTITFLNKLAGIAKVFWVDARGQRKQYLTLKPGEQSQMNTFAGHVWVITDESDKTIGALEATRQRTVATIDGKPKSSTQPTAPSASRRRPATDRGDGRFDWRRPESPDGKWVIAVKNANLWLKEKASGQEFQLSQDGKDGDGYSQGEIWWSADSQKLVALRVEKAQAHPVNIVESSPKGQLQPRLLTFDYLKPGDRIAHPRPRLFDIAQRKPLPVKEDLFANPWSIQDVRWSVDSSRFTFVYNQRGHQALRVVAVDARTGDASAIIDEASPTFIHYSGKFFCRWIGDGEILWMSERDGWNHLWLYDARAGAVKNPITRGPWIVRDVVHVDVAKRQVWFMAGGIRPGQDPYYTHFCRVNFDGTGLTVLTEGDGNHKVAWSPGESCFIDTWSRVDRPPVNELRRSEDGKLICTLEEADASAWLESRGGRWPTRFVAKGRDGATDIFGVIFFPKHFDPAKKYPVLEQIYAGPHGFFTPKSFTARSRTMDMADLGFIVVQCDGMGTSGRSKKFHDVCWKNLRDSGFPDRIAWMKAAAQKYPQMDLTRVGIYGGSAGGQSTMAALLWHNDFYKVGVADCGCHDNRMDKIWWNEQWMGWPIDKSYEENSNAVNAHLLRGKLMLIVGELDHNVDPASTMQVVGALQKADKDFEMLVIVGADHGAAESPYGNRRRREFLMRELGVTPPPPSVPAKP